MTENSTENIRINIQDETAPLEAVILGTAKDIGFPNSNYVHPDEWTDHQAPDEDQINDPKSRMHIINGTYPIEAFLRQENDYFARILAKYNVQIYQPITLEGTNQIFTRDIGFVVDNVFIKSNMGTAKRQSEFFAIRDIVSQIKDEVWFPPASVQIEGGDVFPYKDKIFVGQAAAGYENMRCNRTNPEAIKYLQNKFPDKKVIPVPLKKSDKDPNINCLHLDCAFQPIGNNDHCIIFMDGFADREQAEEMIDIFGGDRNAIKIEGKDMYNMNSNIFSISPKVIVSGNKNSEFGELNARLEDKGFTVERIPYSETSKMEGLLRCSTLPLRRTYK